MTEKYQLSREYLTHEEMEILEITESLMKKYKAIGYQHPNDRLQIIKAAHIIQDLIMQRIARKAEPNVFPVKKIHPMGNPHITKYEDDLIE